MSLNEGLTTLANANKALMTKLESHTTDIARAVVPGSRGQEVEFSTLLSHELKSSRKNANGSYSNPSQLLGSPVAKNISFDFSSQGDAVEGEDRHLFLENPSALFVVSNIKNNQNYYTKAGNFGINTNGEFATVGGYSLMGYAINSGNRTNTLSAVTIGNHTEPTWDVNGVLSALDADGNRVELYQVALTSFNNLSGLAAVDGGVTFEESLASGPPFSYGVPGPQYGLTTPGSFEASNIDTNAETILGTLPIERSLQAVTSAIQAVMKVWDDTMQKLTA